MDDAADCLSEVLLVLWRRRASLPSTLPERRPWAFGVAHNVLANHSRSGSRRLALTLRLRSELLAAPASSPELSLPLDLEVALAGLSLRDRELLLLVAWEGMTVAEAGQSLGLKAPAARARYSRIRRRLRQSLEHQGVA